jgi:hypothetical protein
MNNESTGHAVPVCPDDVFDAISHQRRRRVIMSLARAHEPVPAGDLAVELAAIEEEVDPSTVSGEDRARVYVSLIQSHLPRLDDLGIADYDEQSKRVTPTDATQPVASFIQELETACYQSGDRE